MIWTDKGGGKRALPEACWLCGAEVHTTATAPPLCAPCRTSLPRAESGCRGCALPLHSLADGSDLCGRCLARAPTLPFRRVLAALHYRWPVAGLVRGAKFHADLRAQRVLGCLLADTVLAADRCEHGDGPGVAGTPVQALVPVPLHWSRLMRRGYDQALEIARFAGRALKLPVLTGTARRQRATLAQSVLARDRRLQNLEGAFAVRPLAGLRAVAIVDDVLTTGATAEALARGLRAAGIAEIELWCAARSI